MTFGYDSKIFGSSSNKIEDDARERRLGFVLLFFSSLKPYIIVKNYYYSEVLCVYRYDVL
jgi:hypothetical protein